MIRAGGLLGSTVAACLGLTPGASAEVGPSGGSMFVQKPKVEKVTCLRRCAPRRRARPGSTLKVSGSGLSRVRRVIFHGSVGTADDVRSNVRRASSTRLRVNVPIDAVSGPVSVEADRGLRSRPTPPVGILPAPPPEPNATLTSVPGPRQRGAPKLETGTSRTRAFYGSRRTVAFSYRVSEGVASVVRIDLIRVRDGASVRSWVASFPPPGAVQTLNWDGAAAGAPATPGRYAFRLTVAGRSGAIARSAQVGDLSRDAFDLFDHQFPVPGRHDFGGAQARFGAGRSGHSHQGQDILARCGVPMVAARGGQVKFKGYHRAAGNYVVIDGAGTDLDYAYMHLAEPTPFDKGDRVYTGQRIGAVGQTGDARGCHLHFEMWSAPGWYDGGQPFDPLPALTAWDVYS